MTAITNRSLTGSLDSGATDGKYRKVRPDTEVADTSGDAKTRADRATLHSFYNYGFTTQESPVKVNPGK
jgi:hypothetical protein